MVCFDLTEFFEQCRVRRRQASKTTQCLSGFVVLVLFDEESRRLREEQQADSNNDRESELQRDWDTVGPSVVAVARRIVDNRCQKEALNCCQRDCVMVTVPDTYYRYG